MGGNAFSSHPHPLPMPRMPPDIYNLMLERIQTQLRTIYDLVETPIEAPSKKDHGDIDVIVTMRDERANVHPDVIKKVLGAEVAAKDPGSATSHFAVRWPDEDCSCEDGDSKESQVVVGMDGYKGDRKPKEQRFIQIDINFCSSVRIFYFTLFLKAHGDLWMMLGAIIRRFGFTASPSGLFFRISELESWNKKQARIKLSDEPEEVLRYLALDVERYWSGFQSWDEMMDYVSTCRFHDPTRGKQYDDQETKAKFEVKAHDRSKAGKRPVFRYWLEEYLPAHREAPKGVACEMTQDEVVEDVKAFFGQDFAKVYDQRKEYGIGVISVSKLWSDIRKAMSCTGSDLTYTMKGLKYEVMGEAEGRRKDDLSVVQVAFLDGRYEEVQTWAEKNWEQVKDRQIQRDRGQSTAKLLAHLQKTKLTEAETTQESEAA